MHRDLSRRRLGVIGGALAGALASAAGGPAATQTVTYEGKGVHLAEVLTHLEKVTGYEFVPQSLGTEVETARRDLTLKDASLVHALDTVSRSFRVEFFSVDASGFRVIPLKPSQEKEVAAGPFRVRVVPPSADSDLTSFTMALQFSASEEPRAESISHLSPNLQVWDNFGRSVIDARGLPSRSTTAARSRLLEYRQRLMLRLPDQRAVRLRPIRGSLVCFRKVAPLRIEFPLSEKTEPQKREQSGVQAELLSVSRAGRNITLTTRLSCPESLDLVGRGLSREVKPYLLDDQGRAYRHFTSRIERDVQDGKIIREQSSRFERVEGEPTRLVFEIWVREDPSEQVPFQLPGMPLPERGEPQIKPEQRPFYQKGGGALALQVLDQKTGKPVEGEVTLGIARTSGGGAVRWLEVVTDPEGKARLEQFAPGTYRVTRLFRFAPGARALTDGKGPVEVTVAAGKEAALPPLKIVVPPAGGE